MRSLVYFYFTESNWIAPVDAKVLYQLRPRQNHGRAAAVTNLTDELATELRPAGLFQANTNQNMENIY